MGKLELRRDGLLLASVSVVRESPVAGQVTNWSQLVAAATNSANAGKTFHMRGGSYVNSADLIASQSQPLTFLGYPGEENAIAFQNELVLRNSTNIKIDGARCLKGASLFGTTQSCTLRRLKCLESVDIRGRDCLIDRCDIRTTIYGCIGVGGTADNGGDAVNTTIRDCVIHNPAQDGIFVSWASNTLIEGCEFTAINENGQHNDAIQIYPGNGPVSGTTCRKSYFHDNLSQGFYADDLSSSSMLMDNCLAVRCNQGPGVFHQFALVDGYTATKNISWDSGTVSWSPRQSIRPGGTNTRLAWSLNVFQNAWFAAGDEASVDANTVAGGRHRNIYGTPTNFTPKTALFEARLATPPWVDPSHAGDDYRCQPVTVGGQTFTPGVDWKPSDWVRGPGF